MYRSRFYRRETEKAYLQKQWDDDYAVSVLRPPQELELLEARRMRELECVRQSDPSVHSGIIASHV